MFLYGIYEVKIIYDRLPRIRVGELNLKHDLSGSDSIRLFALGDTGTGGRDQLAVAEAMERLCRADPPDAILLLGDNIYQSGVSSTEDPQWQTKVFGPYGGECLDRLPIYAVLGNHDYKDNPGAQIEYSLINPRWHMPNRFYSVDFDNLLTVVAFDSEFSDACFEERFCTVDFMNATLNDSVAPWRIVMAHHPLKSASVKGFGHSGGLRGNLLLPFICDKADLWLSGHAHHLERRLEEGCRLEMIVSGGGGAKLYDVTPNQPGVVFAQSSFGFLTMDITKNSFAGTFFNAQGQALHQFERQAMPYKTSPAG